MQNVNDFIKLREKDWSRLQALLTRQRALSAAEIRELGMLYRSVASDLAIARRDFPGQRVTLFLNQLLTKAHSSIYREDVTDYAALGRYFTHTIPRAYRTASPFILVAFLLFITPAIISFGLAYTDPSIAPTLGLEEQRQTLEAQSTWTNIPVNERPYAASFIMTNNIRVAILAFGGGVTFGLFTLYITLFNGIHIGTVLGLAAHYGQLDVLVDFIFAHGVIELSVIFMAAGAGLQMGWALINPGLYSRKDALSLAAQKAIPLGVLSVIVLIIAGVIEGFISPSSNPFISKVMVGVVTGVIMYSYVWLMGRD